MYTPNTQCSLWSLKMDFPQRIILFLLLSVYKTLCVIYMVVRNDGFIRLEITDLMPHIHTEGMLKDYNHHDIFNITRAHKRKLYKNRK